MWSRSARFASAAARAIAIVCENRELTYVQYAQAVAALATQLAGRGIAGNRIAFLMRNTCDPPSLKWSDLKYVFGIEEDRYAEEEVQA